MILRNNYQWDSVNAESNPGDMWEIWKKLLMEIIDKHAPLKVSRLVKELPMDHI